MLARKKKTKRQSANTGANKSEVNVAKELACVRAHQENHQNRSAYTRICLVAPCTSRLLAKLNCWQAHLISIIMSSSGSGSAASQAESRQRKGTSWGGVGGAYQLTRYWCDQ